MIAEGRLPDWFVAVHANGCDCGGTLEGLAQCGAAKTDPRYDFVIATLRARQRQAVSA